MADTLGLRGRRRHDEVDRNVTDNLWQSLADGNQFGGFQRVDAIHPLDLYLALDGVVTRGLYSSQSEPPCSSAPRIAGSHCNQACRRKIGSGIWLSDPSLLKLFDQLCRDLVDRLVTLEAPPHRVSYCRG